MSHVGTELPGDAGYPIAWLSWATWAIYAWINADNARRLTALSWIKSARDGLPVMSVDTLINRTAERLESAWHQGGPFEPYFPGWSSEPGKWRAGAAGVLDAAMEFADWQQIAIRLLDDDSIAEERDTESDPEGRVISDPEQLRLLEQGLQIPKLRLVPSPAPVDEKESPELPDGDEDSFFEKMLVDTTAVLGWFEEEGITQQLVDQAMRARGSADDDLVEVLAEHLEDWIDRTAAPPGLRRTRPESPHGRWIDGPHPQQTFSHWLMQAVIEDVDWWLLAELLLHRHGRGG